MIGNAKLKSHTLLMEIGPVCGHCNRPQLTTYWDSEQEYLFTALTMNRDVQVLLAAQTPPATHTHDAAASAVELEFAKRLSFVDRQRCARKCTDVYGLKWR